MRDAHGYAEQLRRGRRFRHFGADAGAVLGSRPAWQRQALALLVAVRPFAADLQYIPPGYRSVPRPKAKVDVLVRVSIASAVLLVVASGCGGSGGSSASKSGPDGGKTYDHAPARVAALAGRATRTFKASPSSRSRETDLVQAAARAGRRLCKQERPEVVRMARPTSLDVDELRRQGTSILGL